MIQKNCWFINSYPRSKRGCAAGGSTKFALFCGSYLPNFLKQPVITAFFNPEEIFRATFKLLKEGRSFKKHTGVKAALHKDLIKEGILEPEWGKFYNKIFDSRHEGDYQPLRVFQAEEVALYVEQCAGFIARMETLLGKNVRV